MTAQLNFSCERASTATCYHALLWWRCAVPADRTGQIELLAKRHGMPRVVIVDAKTVVCANSIGNVARLSDAEAIYQAEPHEIRELMVRSSLPYHITRDLLTEALGMHVSSEQLQAAVRENVFLSRLSGESDTYSSHLLFRDFLRKQLESEIRAAQLRGFHCRSAQNQLRRHWAQRLLLAVRLLLPRPP